jgi:luciferase family oxidoreductase group 1
MQMPLSVLDLVPLGRGLSSHDALAASTELARAVERSGYARLWYAEHHNMPGIATTTPEILIAHVANHTSRIRLGAGGVMLPNHSPLKVAESYRLLEALHPGRIDLGIGRAPGTDPLTALAIRRSRAALETDDFLDQFAELVAYDTGTFPPTHPFRNIRAMPDDVHLPPIWLLGSGDYSAQLAAELGLGFAFAGHFSPEPAEGPMRLYRSLFEAHESGLEAPHAILALAVYCADTEAEAKRMASSIRVAFAQLRTGKPDRLPSPDEALARELTPPEEAAVAFFDRIGIVGAPEQVKARIDEIVARTGADEVMIATHAYDSAARIRSHELVAQVYGAQPM